VSSGAVVALADAKTTQDPETHRITDLFCFYSLPSTALKATPPTNVNAAYLFYYATTSAPSCADLGDGSVAVPVKNWKDETPEERKVLGDRLKALMSDALVVISKVRLRETVRAPVLR
jgi:glycylpeptide N-tetradecanoyltransferase